MNWKTLVYSNEKKRVIFVYPDGATCSLLLESLKKIPVHAKPEVVNEFVDCILNCKDEVFIESWGSSIDFEPCGISFSDEHFEKWLKASEIFQCVNK